MDERTNTLIMEALQKAAQDYGAKKMAAHLDKRPSTLYSELSPWPEPGKAKMGFLDALEIMAESGDFTALHHAAGALGFRLAVVNASPDMDTALEELCQDMECLGQWARVCRDPHASVADVRNARIALVREIEETEARKLEEIRGAAHP